MKVSHCSDIHLEFMDFPDFSKEDGGDVLILNGDILTVPYLNKNRTDREALRICEYLNSHFIPDLIQKYKHVLYLAGNHEFYQGNIQTGLSLIEKWFHSKEAKNMIFMENDHLDIDGVRFIGSTLWSDYFGGDEASMLEAHRGMNDFRIIKNGTITFRPEHALALHKESLKYITHMSKVDMDVVVLTHHAPHASMLNKFHSGNILDGAYYTDLTWLIEERPNIKRWISGHTHGIYENKIGQTLCVSNCRGYYTEFGFKDWKGLKHFII